MTKHNGTYLRRLVDTEGNLTGFGHWCPACKEMHAITTERPLSNGAIWKFNNDFARPSFSPSVRIDVPWKVNPTRCHYFITDGQIIFCSDCSHGMASLTVDLPEWPL